MIPDKIHVRPAKKLKWSNFSFLQAWYTRLPYVAARLDL